MLLPSTFLSWARIRRFSEPRPLELGFGMFTRSTDGDHQALLLCDTERHWSTLPLHCLASVAPGRVMMHLVKRALHSTPGIDQDLPPVSFNLRSILFRCACAPSGEICASWKGSPLKHHAGPMAGGWMGSDLERFGTDERDGPTYAVSCFRLP